MVKVKDTHLNVMRKLVLQFIRSELNSPLHAYTTLSVLTCADKNGEIKPGNELDVYLDGLEHRSKKALKPIIGVGEGDDIRYMLTPKGEVFLDGINKLITNNEYVTMDSILIFFKELLDGPLNILFDVLALSIFIDERHYAWRNITNNYEYYVVHRIKFSAKTPLWYNKFVEYPNDVKGTRDVTRAKLSAQGEELTLNLLNKLIVN